MSRIESVPRTLATRGENTVGRILKRLVERGAVTPGGAPGRLTLDTLHAQHALGGQTPQQDLERQAANASSQKS